MLLVAGEMSGPEDKTETLFDLIPKSVLNLSVGAPGNALLQQCTAIIKTAVAHRMVSVYWNK